MRIVEEIMSIPATEFNNAHTNHYNVAIFSSYDVYKAEEELSNFRNRKGDTWESGIEESKTRERDFIMLYFGEYDDEYPYLPFDAFRGTNKNVTKRLVELFKILEYNDSYNQCACEISSIGRNYCIESFDW